MKISFHGAARDVTGSCYLLECAGTRILIDCGFFQGSRELEEDNADDFGFDPAAIDYLLLTHAHLVHCGLLPIVVREGFRGPIFATSGTIELAGLVLRDSGRLQEEFVERAERRERRDPDAFAAREQRDEAALTEAPEEAAEMEAVRLKPDPQQPPRDAGGLCGSGFSRTATLQRRSGASSAGVAQRLQSGRSTEKQRR